MIWDALYINYICTMYRVQYKAGNILYSSLATLAFIYLSPSACIQMNSRPIEKHQLLGQCKRNVFFRPYLIIFFYFAKFNCTLQSWCRKEGWMGEGGVKGGVRNMKYALVSACFSFHLNLLNLFQDLTDRREFYFGMLQFISVVTLLTFLLLYLQGYFTNSLTIISTGLLYLLVYFYIYKITLLTFLLLYLQGYFTNFLTIISKGLLY